MFSMTTSTPFCALKPYQKRVELLIEQHLDGIAEENTLKQACAYALKNGGRRFRPSLALIISDAIGGKNAESSALAIELFHTASLIADDLPCMDNDDERRNLPSTHKVYGESVALLASYALIADGWGLIAKNGRVLETDAFEAVLLSLENASFNTGIAGATGGQYLDLFPPNSTLETIYDVLKRKTGALFEISFVFGWLFGGGDVKKLLSVKKAAHHFGMAFQLIDDIGDEEQDRLKGRTINLALALGSQEALKLAKEECGSLFTLLKELNLEKSLIQKISQDLLDTIIK